MFPVWHPMVGGQSLFAWQEGKKQCCHPSLDLQYGPRAPSAREAVDGLSTAVGGKPVARWGATPYHCLNQPLENICRDSELEKSSNYFKGLVSEVGLYELVLKWQEAD